MGLALVLGTSALLLFLTPRQIVESVRVVGWNSWLLSTLFFLLGCLAAALRWRACLNFRASFWPAFHSLGVANAGNLHIPGRVGEPLRVYCLARGGLEAQYGTSGVVQERLGDQILRVMFFALALVLGGMSDGGDVQARLLGIVGVTLALALALIFLIKIRSKVARVLGLWFSKLPKLTASGVEEFVLSMLTDLSESWRRPGGRSVLFWGLVSWLLFMLHTEQILQVFLPGQALALAAVVMATAPTTAPTQPGLFHGIAVAAMILFSAERTLALQATIVLHLTQTVLFSLWGMASWFVLMRDTIEEADAIWAEEEVDSATLGTGEGRDQGEPTEKTRQVAPGADLAENPEPPGDEKT